MKAIILAGGFGTRLRPISCTRPKSLFPIVNKPLLEWTFERLTEHGVDEAIMAVNYQTEIAIKLFKIPKHGLHVRYSRDPPRKPLGTAGPIKKAEHHFIQDTLFLTLNGDIFADVNYTAMIRQHKQKKAIATLALHRVKDPSRYGVAELSRDKRIKRFVEKPSRGSAPSDLINAGAYVLDPKIFEYIPKGRPVSMEREVFPTLAEEGRLSGYTCDCLWMDIGKPEDYLQINRALLDSRKGKQELSEQTRRARIRVREPVALDSGVHIGKNSVIGPYAVLGQDVKTGCNVTIRNSVILPGTVIRDSANVNGAIIGDCVQIGKGVIIGRGCIIGDHVKISDNVTLAEAVSVCHAKEITENVLKPGNIC